MYKVNASIAQEAHMDWIMQKMEAKLEEISQKRASFPIPYVQNKKIKIPIGSCTELSLYYDTCGGPHNVAECLRTREDQWAYAT